MREDWVEIELGKVCEYSKGKKPKMLVKKYSKNSPFPYINIKAFEKGIFEEYTNGEKCNLCEEGDLLMVWDGARAGLTGKAKKGAIGSTLMKIEPKNGVEKNYLFYFLLSLYKKLNTNPRGVGIPHVEPRLLWNSIFLMPDIPTQRAIVHKIENLFASLDKGIADLKKAQEQLKVYRQAVLKKAFEGELTKEWREKHVKTDGRPSHVPMAAEPTEYYKNEGAKKFPERWKLVKLSEISEHITDGDHQAPPNSKDGIPFITISNIEKSNNKIDFSSTFSVKTDYYKNLNIKRVPHKGDILYTVTGSFGIPVLIDFDKKFCFQRHIGLIRPKTDINQVWLFHLLQTQLVYGQASEKATGTAQKTVALSTLRNIQIPLCTQNEQHQIVREIESRLTVCDKVEQNITEGLEKSEALRQSILKKAFEGKLLSEAEIEQCKQEADYEPASVLLKKSEQDVKKIN